MKHQNTGFSFVELLIGIGLSFFIMMGSYKFMGTVSQKSTRQMRSNQVNVNVTKWLDRMTVQMTNAIDFPKSSGTVFGNIPRSLAGPPWRCFSYTVDLTNVIGYPDSLIPHGIVPLPQQPVADIDQGDLLTILEPSAPPPDGGVGIDDVDYDAVRIAYFPDGSNPIPVVANVLHGAGYTNIKLSASDLTKFSVGDYAIIFDKSTRELFRITGTTVANELRHTTTSFWNTKFLQDFSSSSAFVQKVQLITYAYDPNTQEVLYDDHVKDDGFNPKTKAFGAPVVRTLNWSVVAPNVESFKIYYSYSSSAIGSGVLTETRLPIAALPQSYSDANCPNQIGFPFFRNIRIEVTLEPPSGSTSPEIITLSRLISPELLRRNTLSSDVSDKPIYIITPGPTPTPSTPSGATQYLGSSSGGF